ncbi:MAG: serine hydrolase [Bacteroidota bacterium]
MKKLAVFAILTYLLVGLQNSVMAQQRSNGVKRLKNFVARHNMSPDSYQKMADKYHQGGYCLTYVDGYSVKGRVRFSAIWQKGNTDDVKARHGLTASVYQAEVERKHKAGYRLIHVDGYNKNGKAHYAAIWKKQSTKGLSAKHGLTGAQYQKQAKKHYEDGYKLVHISGFGVGGKAYYAAIWKKGDNTKQITRHGLTAAEYQQAVNKNWPKGYRVTQVDSYNVGSKVYYAAIFEKVKGRFSARHHLNGINYQLEIDNHYYQGYKPISVSGHDKGGKVGYAVAFKSVGGWKAKDTQQIEKKVKKVMSRYKIPGASIAIVKDGKLVYAQGFGYGNKEKKEIASATSLYRVASISKPITAAAIMKLVEDGKLSLEDKVFGRGAILGSTYGTKAYGKREKAIKVKHLLEHRAGGNAWDNNDDPNPSSGPKDTWNAPMFQEKSKSRKELIGWVLDTRNPSEEVNTVTAYSNFGYCVLGRIIDAKTNAKYQNYVKNKILKPCGITDMRIGAKDKKDRAYREVNYYSSGNPYGLQMKRMDSHGGWIASPVDLMRFAVRVDGKATKKDILKKSTVQTIQTSSYGGRYGKGWDLNGALMQHGGRMSGTRARLKLMDNGIYYAYAVNKYSNGDEDKEQGNNLNGDMSKAIEAAIKTIGDWPDIDLF